MKRLFNEISGKLVNYHSFGPHGGCSAIRLNSSNCQGRAGSTRLNGLQVQISITLLAKWDLSKFTNSDSCPFVLYEPQLDRNFVVRKIF